MSDWHDRAACSGHYVVMEDPGLVSRAKTLCAECPVKAECRADIDNIEDSNYRGYMAAVVWGGETASERFHRRYGTPITASTAVPTGGPEKSIWDAWRIGTPVPDACRGCGVRICRANQPPPPGVVHHRARGLCSACYDSLRPARVKARDEAAARRDTDRWVANVSEWDNWTPGAPPPRVCRICHTPICGRRSAVKLPGMTEHKGRGLCARCYGRIWDARKRLGLTA